VGLINFSKLKPNYLQMNFYKILLDSFTQA